MLGHKIALWGSILRCRLMPQGQQEVLTANTWPHALSYSSLVIITTWKEICLFILQVCSIPHPAVSPLDSSPKHPAVSSVRPR